MHSMTPELKDKLNLYELEDMDDEEFRDVLTDNALLNYKLLPVGESNTFGNDCSLEAISHSEINDYDKDNKFLLSMLEKDRINPESANLVHSKYYLHTQAEDHIKIDIIWHTTLDVVNDIKEYNILGVYFENKEEDGSPNYRPSNSPYWEEWLVDFGINEDPYPQD
tara:strand:+ start:881 stop:1378 length:498 start_codon:yes stop_codon:yes gene_type:complete